MAEKNEELLELLQRHVNEKTSEERAVADTLDLLRKVDSRRHQNPRDRRRWDARANDLEESLMESRRRLAWAEQRIVEERRKLAEPDEAPAKPPASAAANKDIGEARSELPPARQAIERILSSPLFKVVGLRLQDFVLAKLFLEASGNKSLGKARAGELEKRIRIYDRSMAQTKAPARGKPPKERREQMLIRRALDKCRNNQIGTLTVSEIDIIIASYDLIAGHNSGPDDGDRLLVLVNDAIDEICEKWSRLGSLRGARSLSE